jgi:hypothetical protein
MFVQTRKFSLTLDQLIVEHKLSEDDFLEFERGLLRNPEEGDLVSGTGGFRKTRLKSATKGKRGGFRLYYLDIAEKGTLFLVVIYAKNVKEDLSQGEKKSLKGLAEKLRED